MNMPYDRRWHLGGTLAIVVLATLGGCKKEREQTEPDSSDPQVALTTASVLGPESSPVEIDMSKGWCGGHGVPESVCTRCDPSLILRFKAANDWCGGHDLPESQCILCNPEVKARWEAINPRHNDTPSVLGPESSPVEIDMAKGWCGGHGVPESVCTRCDPSLIPRFKAAN
ncbi:MAG: hypothetical protein ACYTFA_13560, partial [Planctomycetota bacterium]